MVLKSNRSSAKSEKAPMRCGGEHERGGGGCVLIIGNYWLGLIRDKERWKQREEREKLFEFLGGRSPGKIYDS